MHLFYALISGLFVSVLSYLTVGPVNMAIIQTTLNESKREGMLFGIGSAIIDTLFCFVALFGYRFIEEHDGFLDWFHLVTIPILLFMGLWTIKKADKPTFHKTKPSGGKFFLLGVIICFSNPVLFGYWLYVTTLLQAKEWLQTTTLDYVFFTAGVFIGIFGFIALLVNLVAYTRRQIPQRWFTIINIILGLFFIGFAIYLLVDYLITHL